MKKTIYLFVLLICAEFTLAQESVRFNHILITNDDGIEDADRLSALAMSVKKVADRVTVIVSVFDRSGTSNYTTYGKHQSSLEVTCRYHDEENKLASYTIAGNPGDCVILGLNALFPDDRPDLVLSGINGGANIGTSWFGSGTVGAARTAAFLGVKAVALSGFNDDDKRSFELVPDWVTQFISSGILDEMDKNSYVTVGFPEMPLDSIKGVKVMDRRIAYDYPETAVLSKIYGDGPHTPENTTLWTVTDRSKVYDESQKHDDTYLDEGYIIVTPMTINENHYILQEKFQEKSQLIPEFVIK